jgi:hypothetical protein
MSVYARKARYPPVLVHNQCRAAGCVWGLCFIGLDPLATFRIRKFVTKQVASILAKRPA